MFCIPKRVGKANENVISTQNVAAARSHEFLLRRQTLDGIVMICLLSNTNFRITTSLFDPITSNKVALFNNKSVIYDERFSDPSRIIKCDDVTVIAMS